MGWNGSGGWTRLFSWVADKAAAINITASRMDAEFNDYAQNGWGNTITRDGQGVPVANIPFGNFKITGLGAGVNRTDSAQFGQIQDSVVNWVAAGGSADALTATYVPALTALNDGQLCYVRAASPNATTTPTFAPNGLPAHTITKFGGQRLAPGDIAGANYECILRYNLAGTNWEMLNPATSIDWDGHCLLKLNTSTQIILVPLRGCTVPLKQTNGVWAPFVIPSAGITANITNTFLNGVGGSNLAGTTLYYVYLWWNSGSPVIDFSTTGHATDAATGVEVKNGDNTRTLVGMVYPNATPNFIDNQPSRDVASWFNRSSKVLNSNFNIAGFSTSGSFAGIGNSVVDFLVWGDDNSGVIFVSGSVTVTNFVSGDSASASLQADGAGSFAPVWTQQLNTTASVYGFAVGGPWALNEGHHAVQALGLTNSTRTVTWTGNTYGTVRS